MADTKLTSLPAIATGDIDNSVLIYCVDVTGGNISSKVTRSALYLDIANVFTKGQTISPVLATALILNPTTTPVGSSSSFHSGLSIASGTVAFATTPQTGDYTSIYLDQSTLTNPSSGTVPNAATLKIVGAPIASTNVTITNAYSLWVAGGTTLLQSLTVNGNITLSTSSSKILDTNGNAITQYLQVSSAVNYLGFQNSATGNQLQIQFVGSDSNGGITLVPKGTGICMGSCETIELDLSDETSLPTTGVKITTGIPYNMSLVAATAYVTTAGTGATLVEMDALIESAKDSNSFSTIFTTRPKIAASTFTSNSTGSTSAVLTSTPLALTKDTRIQGKIQAIDTGTVARGYKILLIGYRTA